MINFSKIKNKFGFSLFEMVVTMAIVAIFIAACSNAFTQRRKATVTTPIHGRFECYRKDDGKVYQRLFNEDTLVVDESEQTNGYCTFNPPKYAAQIVISAVAAGGYGGDNLGGSPGQYDKLFLSVFKNVLRITPGVAVDNAATPVGNQQRTIIQDMGPTGNSTSPIDILNLLGGKSDSAANIEFSNCTIGTAIYSCAQPPSCTVDLQNRQLDVTYCWQNGSINDFEEEISSSRVVHIPFSISSENESQEFAYYGVKGAYSRCHRYLANGGESSITKDRESSNLNIQSICSQHGNCNDPQQLSSGLVDYIYQKWECPDHNLEDVSDKTTIFSLNLNINGNYTPNTLKTDFDGDVDGLGINVKDDNKGIAGTRQCTEYNDNGTVKNSNAKCRISTGDGGGKSSRGGNGAVMITW